MEAPDPVWWWLITALFVPQLVALLIVAMNHRGQRTRDHQQWLRNKRLEVYTEAHAFSWMLTDKMLDGKTLTKSDWETQRRIEAAISLVASSPVQDYWRDTIIRGQGVDWGLDKSIPPPKPHPPMSERAKMREARIDAFIKARDLTERLMVDEIHATKPPAPGLPTVER
ncbi:hypothetical protein [Serinicoccus marinus]|uniref:hypothetical protein n=1 Tax=Serinicoccus marinus TaxID=247333 RepID=UPI00122DEFC5|nr:hypothetical protein [Serinicoccus marinus]